MPNNLLKPGAKVKQFNTGDKPYKRETFNHILMIYTIMADQNGVFKDKQHWLNFTSLERLQEFVKYSLKIETKNYPKLELVVPLNNHIQSMITGCINVFPL